MTLQRRAPRSAAAGTRRQRLACGPPDRPALAAAQSAGFPLPGLLDAGDPYGEVRDAWHAKETLRSIYDITDTEVGAATVAQLAGDLQDPGLPPELNRLGRTIWRWRAPGHPPESWRHRL